LGCITYTPSYFSGKDNTEPLFTAATAIILSIPTEPAPIHKCFFEQDQKIPGFTPELCEKDPFSRTFSLIYATAWKQGKDRTLSIT